MSTKNQPGFFTCSAKRWNTCKHSSDTEVLGSPWDGRYWKHPTCLSPALPPFQSAQESKNTRSVRRRHTGKKPRAVLDFVVNLSNTDLNPDPRQLLSVGPNFTAYRDDPEVRDIVRLLEVLPIVPEDRLNEAWISIHAAAPCNKPGVGDLLNYMVHTWMGDYPVFNRQLWNQYNNLGEESVRTNNHLESFHSSFRKAFRNPHPNIFVLISELKKRQKATEISVSQLNRGAAPPPKKKRNVGKEKTILRLKEQFDAGARPLMSYMKAMGITVKLA
ncbi:hypothetical protein ACOMHN_016218 [Nucella lapillus]